MNQVSRAELTTSLTGPYAFHPASEIPGRTPAATVNPRRGHLLSSTILPRAFRPTSRGSTMKQETISKTENVSNTIKLAFARLLLAILRTAVLVVVMIATAQAEPRRHERKHRESHNYIIERQQAGAVSGTPMMRRIRGSREIDIYRDGSMFERNNYIGNAKGGR